MKNRRILITLLSVSLAASFAGCKKEETQEPVMIYYSEGQQEADAVTVTFQNEEAASAGQSEPGTTEVLAPIIASRDQASPAQTMPSAETSATETTETTQTTQTTAPSETAQTEASSETTAATETTQAASSNTGSVPTVSGSHISDGAGVIADEASVNSAMASFESSTGVSPAIFTISDSLTGDDFRSYARDIYTNNFNDQDHVLIVYQLTPAGTWSWTCVFGTNTGTVFDQDTIDTFQSNLTNAFSSSNVDNALVTTFNSAVPQA